MGIMHTFLIAEKDLGIQVGFGFVRPNFTCAGVCIFCKDPIKPVRAYDSLCKVLFDLDERNEPHSNVDAEGRSVILQFKTNQDGKLLSVISVYCPHVDPENLERAKFKDDFLNLLELVVSELIASGRCVNQFCVTFNFSYVVLAGDLNICHKPIDHFSLTDYQARIIFFNCPCYRS